MIGLLSRKWACPDEAGGRFAGCAERVFHISNYAKKKEKIIQGKNDSRTRIRLTRFESIVYLNMRARDPGLSKNTKQPNSDMIVSTKRTAIQLTY